MVWIVFILKLSNAQDINWNNKKLVWTGLVFFQKESLDPDSDDEEGGVKRLRVDEDVTPSIKAL